MKRILFVFTTFISTCFSEPNKPLWFEKDDELISRVLMIEHNLNMMMDIICDQKYIGDINENFLDDMTYYIHQCRHHLGVESMY